MYLNKLIAYINSSLVVPRNGSLPNTKAYNITPIAQTSEAAVAYYPLSNSGAIYGSVPILILSLPIQAIPKSTIFIYQFLNIFTWLLLGETSKMFSNFKSLCIRFFLWQ